MEWGEIFRLLYTVTPQDDKAISRMNGQWLNYNSETALGMEHDLRFGPPWMVVH